MVMAFNFLFKILLDFIDCFGLSLKGGYKMQHMIGLLYNNIKGKNKEDNNIREIKYYLIASCVLIHVFFNFIDFICQLLKELIKVFMIYDRQNDHIRLSN